MLGFAKGKPSCAGGKLGYAKGKPGFGVGKTIDACEAVN